MKQILPLWIFPILSFFAVGTVWLRLNTVRVTYQIQSLQNEIRNAQQELEFSKVRLSKMRSPQRLELLARSRLGLAPPRADQRIQVTKLDRR